MSFSESTHTKLLGAFLAEGLTVYFQPTHAVVYNSKNITDDKISKIVEKAGFCPLISKFRTLDQEKVFTIFPYSLPEKSDIQRFMYPIPLNVGVG